MEVQSRLAFPETKFIASYNLPLAQFFSAVTNPHLGYSCQIVGYLTSVQGVSEQHTHTHTLTQSSLVFFLVLYLQCSGLTPGFVCRDHSWTCLEVLGIEPAPDICKHPLHYLSSSLGMPSSAHLGAPRIPICPPKLPEP